MKAKLILLVICAALFSLTVDAKTKDGKAITGNSLSDLGKYTITKAEAPIVYHNQALETYDLMYENAANPVHIGILKEKKCRTFIVRNDEFEVQYTCTNGVFGVKKIEKRFQEIPKEEMELKLNKVSYYAQRVICQDPTKSTDDLLGLIACYFPDLVNEDYSASF